MCFIYIIYLSSPELPLHPPPHARLPPHCHCDGKHGGGDGSSDQGGGDRTFGVRYLWEWRLGPSSTDNIPVMGQGTEMSGNGARRARQASVYPGWGCITWGRGHEEVISCIKTVMAPCLPFTKPLPRPNPIVELTTSQHQVGRVYYRGRLRGLLVI